MNTIHRKYYSGEQVFDIISECKDRTLIELLNKFAEVPSADVVEVVRCKDCKWMDVFCCCTKFNVVIATKSTFFCALGERRDDEQEERVQH